MKISLIDKRVKSDEPGSDTRLGETTGLSLLRNGGLHILDIETNLAYHLRIRMTKADVEELKNQLIKTEAKK